MQQKLAITPALDTNALGLQLFESSPDCLKVLSKDGKVLAMNRNGMCAMEIDDFSLFSGAQWKSFWPQESQADIDAALAQACAGGSGQLRAFCPTAKGSPRWWEVVVSAVPGRDGEVANLLAVSRDITPQVEAEAERERLLRQVQAANARMMEIFHHTPAFMCVFNGPDHVVELINERYLQLVGNRNLVGQHIRQALPEVDGQGYFELLDAVYRTGEPFTGSDLPVMLQRHPGAPLEQRFVDLVFTPLRDADGAITGLLVHGVDQTERKRAEIGLYASRERFAKLVGQAATGVVEMDRLGSISFVNQKFCAMLERSESELIGMRMADITAPGSLDASLAAVEALATGGPSIVIDKHYLRKDGSLMPATSSVNALRGPDGEYQGMVAIVLDTTESRQAAEKLRASEERYRTLFESMDQGFAILEMIFDDDGTPLDYRFLEMNTMFERHTGLAGATGKTARDMVPTLDRFWFDTYGRVALTGEPVRFENEAAAMGRWFDVYATRLGGAGSRKVALLFSDITARRRSEEQLRRLAADLSEADRRKTEFLATLAHELRNPLAPIRSGLGVMRLSGHHPATVSRVRDMMERQVGHMVRLIDDLLDIARISGGKLELKRERTDLKGLLASAVETSLPLVEAGRHRLDVAVPDTPLMVDADVTRITQVVSNLLNNAAKYTPPGGRIDLSLRREGESALISVSDTGVGIPSDSLTRIFDMFQQVERHIERAQGGLGIGLSLVRRLVELHGGSVRAVSAGAGRGSCFEVRLPLAGAGPGDGGSDRQHGGAAARQPEGIRVLVVDDNVDAALTLSMILEASGHTTRVAHDGIAALEQARRFLPQVAFLDIGMPGLNGYETAGALRRIPGLETMRLVALTGWGTESDRLRSSEAGFDHHLTKPAQLQAVQELLTNLAPSGE